MIAIIAPAIISGKFVVYCPCMYARPAVSVIFSCDVLTISGHIRSFQANRRVRIPSETSPGFARGSMIRQ